MKKRMIGREVVFAWAAAETPLGGNKAGIEGLLLVYVLIFMIVL
jgi:hypothetical protein